MARARAITTATQSVIQTDIPDHFAAIGAYGFARVQPVLLAALVTEDPLLLIGRAGTGKTYLLNSISEALGLEHRHYNASLVAFDDLVGFPFPDDARERIRFLETPATVWGAESVLVDEISRCRPEHQNRLFSLVHERRVQGIALEKLRYRWAAMNPAGADQGGGEEYAGSEPLDPALADRFATIVEVGDWGDLNETQQRRVANPAGEGRRSDDGGALRSAVARWRSEFVRRVDACPEFVIEYARAVATELNRAGLRISPRRVRLLARSLLAASIVTGGTCEPVFRTVLECSLPQRAWGERPKPERVAAAHRVAWSTATSSGSERWLHDFHLAASIKDKVQLLTESCPDTDTGTLAIEQLLAHERPERVAAFALAAWPAAVGGVLRIGAEGLADLGKIALPVLEVDGEIRWREQASHNLSTHPELARVGAVIDALSDEPARAARARQLLYWALVNNIEVPDPQALETELEDAVQCLAERTGA